MSKRLFVVVFLVLCFMHLPHAEAGEKITLSTYYPAPYGEYESLSVGSGYTAPLTDGNLIVERRVGIGTTSPARHLSVRGTNEAWIGVEAGSSHTGGLLIGTTGADWFGRVAYNNSTNALSLWSNNVQRLTINSGGNVGIGTTTPQKRLHIEPASNNNFILASTANNADAKTVLRALGARRMSFGIWDNSWYLYYTDNSNNARMHTITGSAYDIAEWYDVSERDIDTETGWHTFKEGEIVCVAKEGGMQVEKFRPGSANRVLGVVSANPYIVLGDNKLDSNDTDDMIADMTKLRKRQIPVALTGRAPVIVSNEGGEILPGDPITVSKAYNGIGRRGSKTVSLGKALDKLSFQSKSPIPVDDINSIEWNDDSNLYELPSGTIVGKVMMLISLASNVDAKAVQEQQIQIQALESEVQHLKQELLKLVQKIK
jgi:hypothetical protein